LRPIASRCGVTRRPNRRTLWSAISLAISQPQRSAGPQSVEELDARDYLYGGRSCGGLGQRHPNTPRRSPPGAPRLSTGGYTPGTSEASPDGDPRPPPRCALFSRGVKRRDNMRLSPRWSPVRSRNMGQKTPSCHPYEPIRHFRCKFRIGSPRSQRCSMMIISCRMPGWFR
jgi:hypothetical protein